MMCENDTELSIAANLKIEIILPVLFTDNEFSSKESSVFTYIKDRSDGTDSWQIIKTANDMAFDLSVRNV